MARLQLFNAARSWPRRAMRKLRDTWWGHIGQNNQALGWILQSHLNFKYLLTNFIFWVHVWLSFSTTGWALYAARKIQTQQSKSVPWDPPASWKIRLRKMAWGFLIYGLSGNIRLVHGRLRTEETSSVWGGESCITLDPPSLPTAQMLIWIALCSLPSLPAPWQERPNGATGTTAGWKFSNWTICWFHKMEIFHGKCTACPFCWQNTIETFPLDSVQALWCFDFIRQIIYRQKSKH